MRRWDKAASEPTDLQAAPGYLLGTKKPDSDGDTLGLATLRTAVSVGQRHSLMR